MTKKRRTQRQPARSIRKKLKPKTDNQAEYIRGMLESDITFCSGPAGTGKTAVAVGVGCEYILENKISKIVITRPVVESGRGLGFLPGTLTEKVQPYLVPIMEEMKLYLGLTTYKTMRENNMIEVCPLEYMRGRNFHDTFMILDEAQNATFEQIKMFLTRIGIGSKAIINGDLDQTDLRGGEYGGLHTCMSKLDDLAGVSICELDDSDIVRNGIISSILKRLK
jgi:phosphate starvation-inducible PhoH-like protein|tara:strand:- start:10670 stop:11338 length:669 start_codon:yes stop_codon:yes gene_type:complete